MKIIGYLGSPRANGNTGKLLKRALEGAASKGAETKKVDLIKYNIEHCKGCNKCYHNNPELKIGICPIKDDMASILEEYVSADGYFLCSPVYDMNTTALMKKFVERKIALSYRPKEAYAKICEPREAANFKKMASFIVTANSPDEYEEVMGVPCYDTMNSHLMIEQVWLLDKLYCGGVEDISKEAWDKKMDLAFEMGVRLVEEIEKAQNEEDDE